MNKTLITLVLCFMALSAIAKDRLVVSKAPAGIELKKTSKCKHVSMEEIGKTSTPTPSRWIEWRMPSTM